MNIKNLSIERVNIYEPFRNYYINKYNITNIILIHIYMINFEICVYIYTKYQFN